MESVESSLSIDSKRQSGYNMGVMEKKSEIAFFMTVLAGGLWGTSAIFVHYLSPFGFTPVQMVAARGAVSFAGVFLYAIVKERKLFRIRPIELTIYLLIGGALFFTAFCYYTSMTLTSVATAAMLLGLSPVYVVLFSAVLWREKMSGLKTAAIIGVLSGGVFVSGVIEGMIFDTLGFFMGLASGLSYAIYTLLTKYSMMRNFKAGSATLYGFFFMALIAVGICHPAEALRIASAAPFVTVPLLIGIGLVTYLIPYSLYTVSLKALSSGTVSALGIVEPLSATLFGTFLFGEKLTVWSVAGIVLILSSVVLLGKAAVNVGQS